MSALPLWREFDPLPILSKRAERKRKKGAHGAQDLPQDNDIGAEERIFEFLSDSRS